MISLIILIPHYMVPVLCYAPPPFPLSTRQVKADKKMPGELIEDDPLATPDGYEVSVQSVILDTVTSSIHMRFSAISKLSVMLVLTLKTLLK